MSIESANPDNKFEKSNNPEQSPGKEIAPEDIATIDSRALELMEDLDDQQIELIEREQEHIRKGGQVKGRASLTAAMCLSTIMAACSSTIHTPGRGGERFDSETLSTQVDTDTEQEENQIELVETDPPTAEEKAEAEKKLQEAHKEVREYLSDFPALVSLGPTQAKIVTEIKNNAEALKNLIEKEADPSSLNLSKEVRHIADLYLNTLEEINNRAKDGAKEKINDFIGIIESTPLTQLRQKIVEN